MAKIKSIKIQLGERVYDIVVKCSTTGMFSFEAPGELRSLIKELDDAITKKYQSLKDLESEVMKFINDFRTAETKTRLVIQIKFSAKGEIVKGDNGVILPGFGTNERFHKQGWFNEDCSCIEFGYSILFEESINGKITYYNAIKTNSDTYKSLPNYRVIDGYIAGNYRTNRTDKDIFVPYSPEIIKSLQSIEVQLSNAAIFLSKLLDNENLETLLISGNNKLLIKE